MLRALKWLIYLILAAVAVVAILAIVVLFVVDPNAYRGRIEQEVEARTGRALEIEGDLGLSFYPLFGIELGETRLAEAEGFGDEPFVEVDRVRLAVQLMPLLSGELRLETVLLERPRLRLVRLEDGRANWETLSPAGSDVDPEQARRAAEIAAERGVPVQVPEMLRDARLSGLDLREARIEFEDRAADTELVLDPLDLAVEDARLGAPMPLRASWRLARGGEEAMAGSLEAVVEVSEDLAAASASGIDLELTALGDAVPGGSQTMTLSGDLQARPLEQSFSLADLAVEVAGLTLSGEAEGAMGADGAEGGARLTLAEASPRAVFEALEIEPPPTRDDDVLQTVAGEAELRFAGGRLEVENLSLRLDDSELIGRAGVDPAGSPRITFALQLDEIDLDRYLPPEGAGDEQPEEGEDEPPDGDPLAALRELDMEGQIQIGRLVVAGAQASDISLSVTAADGELRINPLTANLYEGRYSGDLTLDASGETPRITVNEQLSGIQAEPLLGALADFDRLLGTGDLSISASGEGLDADSLLATLDGEVSFSFTDGTLRGINIAHMLRQGAASLRGEAAAEEEGPRETDFSSLSGTMALSGGQLRNDDLEMLTPLLRITGEGGANLAERSVDYRLTVNVVDTLEGQGGRQLQELRRIPVPLRFSGDLMSPEISLALDAALEGAVGERLEEERERVEQRLEEEGEQAREKVEEEIGDGLRRLLRE